MRPKALVTAALTTAAVVAFGATLPASTAFADDPGPTDPFRQLPTHELADQFADAPAPDLSTVPGAPGVPGLTNSGVDSVAGHSAAEIGAFGLPFAPPGPNCPNETQGSTGPEQEGITCKPAAVSTVVLPNGKVLYWDGLEGMEDVDLAVAAEIGDKTFQDQTRLMDLRGSKPV